LSSPSAGDGHVALHYYLIGTEHSQERGSVADSLSPERVSNARVCTKTDMQFN